MDLGTSAAVFITLAIVLLILFCLVTKYFNYKLKKALQDANQVYSMIDEIHHQSDQDQIEGEYDEFLKKRNEKKNKRNSEEKDMLIEMTEVKEPLNVPNDIYGLSMLRRRLNGEVIPMKQESNRSMSSLKSFRPQKINTTNRSDRSNEKQDLKKKEETVIHSYINKLVAYNEAGVHVLQIKVLSVKKNVEGGSIEEKKNVKNTLIKASEENFQDQLEIFGFEKGEYGAYKYETTLQIPRMKTGDDYPVKSLKSSESKQQIDFSDYFRLKDQIQTKQVTL